MLDRILFHIYDLIFDTCLWPAIEPRYRQAAARAGFQIAFIIQWAHNDDQPTLASRRR